MCEKTSFELINESFVDWFCANGGIISPKIAFKDYSNENAGRGMMAVEEIGSDEVLFEIPRSILLSPKTSLLKNEVSTEEYKKLYKINHWFPLILCMMYESQKENSLWKPYFDILPKQFETPMFWTEEELTELQGTGVIDKIGKADSEKGFYEHLLPIIQSKPNVFKPDVHNINLFHQIGSLIMSNAFNEENGNGGDNKISIVMIPMADMLNHKTGYNNARLYQHKGSSLQMIAIKKIKKGEQIFNTYGDLCNADLLRKYGFVDDDNIHNIVEINGQLVIDILSNDDDKIKEKKIDWLLKEDILDDVFILDKSAKIMTMDKSQFIMLKKHKKSLPNNQITTDIQQSLIKLLQKQMSIYKTSIKEDEEILIERKSISHKLVCAIVVRLGEKRILQNALDKLINYKVDQNSTVNGDINRSTSNKKRKLK
ncbi:3085_t:CDS:10 [Entrophospora sp. SA101]|nr:3085_t:CDS:10 [Entrophospora sp. SA101]CAJ0835862.1 8115_t:CDS:10 [Entrophospora sp. SA101]